MRDPYEVLEIKKGASKEEIRAAYKKLAKQYHPDQYDNNPLKDLAEEKMSEVNEAYDYLMKNTSDNTSKNYNQGSTYNNQQSNNRGYNQGQSQKQNYSQNNNQNYNQNNQYNPSAAYEAVRNCINYNNLNEAQRQLNSMPFRDAEWNYLMGLIFLRKGWYEDARRYITTASSMNPTSYEYRNALNQLQMQTNQYRTTYNNRNRNDVDMCDCCTQLWCADTLCECMGGDLISCC